MAVLLLESLMVIGGVQPPVSSAPITLDLASGVRESSGAETVTYDSAWQGDSAAYKITVNDVELATRDGCGEIAWQTQRPGVYVFKASAYIDGILTGEPLTATFRVLGRDLVDATVTFPEARLLADGTPQMPCPQVKLGDKVLTEGVDYTLSYKDNVGPGVGKVILTGIGGYHDEVERTFTIVPAGSCFLDIKDGCRLTKADELLAYDFQWHGATVGNTRMQVRVNDAILGEATGIGDMAWRPTAGVKYVVKLRTYVDDYLQEDAVETAYFGIPGGDLNDWALTIALERDSYLYDGQPKTPKVTVKTPHGELEEGVDFTVSYRKNVDAGVATAIVSGCGLYSGQVERPFRIIAPFALARQRYPWNGKVDVELDVQDAQLNACAVTLVARDGFGGTNLLVKTVLSADMTRTNTTWTLVNGKIRLIWDADADIKNDCVLSNVVLEARIANPNALPSGYTLANGVCAIGELPLDLKPYPSSVTLTDVTSRTITYDLGGKTVNKNKKWTKDTINTKTGTFAYKSEIDYPESYIYMTATVKGKGSFSFWWKLSCCDDCQDDLSYLVRNVDTGKIIENGKIRGTTDWAKITIPVTSTGNTEIQWVHGMAGNSTYVNNNAWIDASWAPQTVIVTNMPSSWEKFIPESEWVPTRTITKRQTLAYSTLWELSADEGAQSEILLNGAGWKTNAGEGVEVWRPEALGTYEFTHRILSSGASVGNALKARFIVADNLDNLDDLFCVIDLSGGPNATRWPVSYLSAIPEGGWTDEYKTTKLVMRRIERGSISGINSGIDDAVSSITIDKPYYIGVFEVTRAQYALMKGGTGDARPQENLSYNALRGTSAGALYPDSTAVDSTSLIGILRDKTGLTTLDLPTEAQWEYACRAGTTSDYNNGGSTEADLATLGRYKGNQNDGRGGYSGGVTAVGSYAPNFWGLYDMHGNAYEWCLEWLVQGRYRVLRGGSCLYVAVHCRAGERGGFKPSSDGSVSGFRLCCSSEIAIDDGAGGAGGRDSRFSYSGVYDGQGHGIAVEVMSVSEPHIRYALAQEGPYSDSLLLTNACTETAVWYAVSAAGYSTYTNWATVTIAPRPVTLTSGSASKVYDGAPLAAHTVTVGGDGFVDGEGATFDVTGSQTTVGTSANTFAYSLNDGTKAGNYTITTAYGTLEVTKATVGPGGGDEPGGGEVPEGGASKFDVTALYDGAGHTIDTNALAAAFGAAMAGAGETRVFYGCAAAGAAATGQGLDADAGVDAEQGEAAGLSSATGSEEAIDWREVAPAFTNAGEYAVWYKVTNPNYEDFVHAAKVTITKRAVTLTSGSASKVYDGTPLTAGTVTVGGDGFVTGEGATFDVTGAQTAVGTSANTFAYSLNDGTKSGNYAIATAYGTLEVTKATVGPGGGDEPGGGELPAGGASKFDAAALYDGEGHTIDTNALAAVFGAAMAGAGETRVLYGSAAAGAAATGQGLDADTGADAGQGLGVGLAAATGAEQVADWREVAPAFTNAGEYAVWYKVTNPNYEDFVHAAKVTITKRPVTVTSADGHWIYDGQIHANATVTTDGFVDGEGIVARAFAEIRDVGVRPNAFEYAFDDGTLAANYAVTCVTGTLSVAAADMTGWTDEAKWSVTLVGDGATYDGAEKTCSVAALSYDGLAIPTFTVSGNVATDAGAYTLVVAGAGNFVGTRAVPWSIRPRRVTLAAPTKTKAYDGTPLTFGADEIAVGGDGFVTGECLDYLDFASLTDVGEIPSTFGYRDSETAKASNYAVTIVDARLLTVTKRPVMVAVTGRTATHTYDATERRVAGYDISTADALYDVGADTAFGGVAEAVRTDAGTTAMGLSAADFANGNANFDVTYRVTDGGVTIAPLDIGTVEDGAFVLELGASPKYNGTEQSIAVRAATCRGLPVSFALTGAAATHAGDYTLTLTGIGNFTGSRSAGWRILPRPVTLTSGSARKVYDGTPLVAYTVAVGGDGFVAGEGATFDVTGSQTAVGTSANTFAYSLNDGTKAGNYAITTAYGTLEVTKAMVGPGSGDEPGGGELPAGGVSKFDATAMYDGEGHTIDTNALVAAFGAAMAGAGETRFFYGSAAAGAAATGQGLDADTGSDAGQGLGAEEAAATEQGEGGGLAAAMGAEQVADWREVAPAFTNAGEYAVWYRVTNPNYEDFVHRAKVTITKRPVTVVVTGHTATFTYDTTAKRVAGYDISTADALYDPDADTAFGGAAEAVRTDAGTTAMGLPAADFANDNANFDVTYQVTDGWVKIEPRVIGDDPANWDIRLGRATRYDGAEHEAPIIQVCYVKPDGNLDNVPYTLSGHTATDAGSYTVRIAGTGNYAGSVEKEWSITPRSVTLASGSAAWTYDGAPHREASVAVGGDGFADGEGATYSGFPTVKHVADAATPQTNTFAYALNANTKARNYEIATAHGTVQMAPRALTLTAPTKTKTYDGAPLTFWADEVAVGGDGYAAGETFALGGFASLTEAGRVDAAFTVSDGTARMDDYAVTTVFGTLTVARNATEIAVTAKSGSWVYDGEAHALHDYEATNLGALLAGDALAVAFDEASAVTTPVDGPNGDGVVANVITGVRVMRGDRDVTRNYTLVAYPGTLRVTRRPVTLTSKSDTKAYDGTPLVAHGVTVGGDGFVDGEGATYAFTGAQTAVGMSENTFAYSLNDGTKAGNYEITTAYGTLEVTKATVGPGGGDEPGGGEVPEGGLSAFDATAMYDGEGHTLDTNALAAAFGAAMAGGETRVLYGCAAAGAAATGQGLDADAGADAGQGLAAEETAATEQGEGGGLAAATGAESVADWREVAPAFTNAGEYAVWYRVTNPNYEDFVHTAKVTITKRAVTVKSRSRTKPYDGTPLRLTAGDVEVSLTDGGTDPALPSGEAFVYGDFAERTAAGETEATFTVSAGAGTQLANYALTFACGTLTVTKATYPGQEPGGAGIAWSVAADAATWVYDGQAHGVTLTGVPAGVTVHLAGNAAMDAGDYVATVTLDYDAANYEPPAAPAPLAWSITPRPVTLMAASKEKPYDGFPLAVRPGDITASGRGYAPGECFDYFDFASLTDVGEIPATFGYRDSATAKVANYMVTVVGGQTLKVTVGGDQISVTAGSGTWAYDGAEHRAETWSVHNGDKLLEGHALQVAIDPASAVRTPKDGPDGDGVVSNRFASVRIVETATGADRTRNYNLVLCEGVLQMTNACIRAERLAGTADIEKTYDGAATQAVVTAVLLQPATVRYAVGAALPADGWAAEPPSFVHAGTQTVWYAVSADYYEPYTNSLRVAVAPRPVTLTTPTKAKPYDGSPLTFGADEVAVGGDGYALGESFVLSDFASLSDAGRIAARCAYAAGAGTWLADYAVTERWGTLTVLASADEITVTAADGSWSYDGTAHVCHAYAAENADTLQPGDELVVAFAPESVVLTPEDGPNGDGVVSNVVASVRVVRNGSEDVTRNYSLAWYPGTLRVTKAHITFDREGSVDPSAFSTSATYDGAGHTAEVVPPVLLTDPVTVRYGTSADAVALDAPPAFTNAGVHAVFYTLDAPYYETYAGTATVTITPRPVTLVSAGAEKVYDGMPLRADAVRVKEGSPGFVGSEGFAAACRGALTDVGAMENLFDYALTGGALAGNYAISKEYGWLRVTPATLDPGTVFGGGETDAEGRLVCARVYNGAPQPFAPAVDFGEPYRLLYALVAGDEGAYGEAAPTRTHVAEGDLVVYFKFMSPNYAPYYGTGVLRIAPKALTEEMVVADEDAAWFFDGTEKKPSVTVVDGSPNIATADDWTVAYSDRTGAGLFPVTVTGRNDYCGTVTKEFAILKRPVAPPVIPPKAYSGRLQRPSVPSDARWTVVANPGGTDAGDYTNVVLRLASPDDYRWKGLGEDETDWTGVFTVCRGANGWSVYPLVRSWTNGVDVASEPLGRPRFGTLSVAYRRRGASVETESPLRPSAPGRYTARFWAEETANYAGVALVTPYEVDFEIFPGPGDPPAGDATATTPVPVPHAWLDAYVARFGAGDYEAAASAVGANGVALWASYVAGLDPTDAASRFTAAITVDADGVAHVTWSPDLSAAEPPRAYTVYGKAGLGDAEWTPVTDANRARMRFFRVQVELK